MQRVPLGRPTSRVQSLRNQVRYEHDDVDSAGKFTGGRGLLEAIRQNPTGEADGSAPELAYTYEQQVEDGELVILRPQKVEYPGGREVHPRYSDSGVGQVLSRLEAIAPDAETSDAWAEYGYLGAATITRTARPKVQGGLELDYDPDSDGSFSGWDRFGSVIEHEWRDGNDAVLDGYHYGYNAAGSRTFRENVHTAAAADDLDEFYSHDWLHRLAGMERGGLNQDRDGIDGTPGFEQDWGLDVLGNWEKFEEFEGGSQTLDQDRTHNEANEIETIDAPWPDPTHDAAGNITSAPAADDPDQRRHFVYDAWNRLVAVHEHDETDPENPVGDLIVTYRYNGLNHRVRKLVGDDPQNPDEVREFYYNEQWQVLEERRELAGDQMRLYAEYVWCVRYIDSPIVRFRDSNADDGETAPDGTLDETLYYTTDANMNVTALVAPGSGDVVERYVYDPYGRAAVLDGNWQPIAWSDSKRNEIRFTGHRFNPTTGTYHARNREYHPALGRWMQRDPLGYVDGMSLYAGYFAMWGAVDPSGQSTFRELINDTVSISAHVPEWDCGAFTCGDGFSCHLNGHIAVDLGLGGVRFSFDAEFTAKPVGREQRNCRRACGSLDWDVDWDYSLRNPMVNVTGSIFNRCYRLDITPEIRMERIGSWYEFWRARLKPSIEANVTARDYFWDPFCCRCFQLQLSVTPRAEAWIRPGQITSVFAVVRVLPRIAQELRRAVIHVGRELLRRPNPRSGTPSGATQLVPPTPTPR